MHSDFALGQVDVDIRYGVPEWPNLMVEPVFDEHILPLASPDLLARQPTHVPSDLLKRPLIQSTVSLVQWPAWFASRNLIGMPERFAFRFDRASMSLEAAVQGLGVALESDKIAFAVYRDRPFAAGFPYRLVAADQGPFHGLSDTARTAFRSGAICRMGAGAGERGT